MMLAIAVGCNGGKTASMNDNTYGQGGIILLADPNQRIPDVPIPMDFKLVEERSRHFAAGDARVIDHLYKGRADKFAVGRFYRQRMRGMRWKLVTDRFVQGTVTLVFHKGAEECTVNVTGKGGWFRPTHVMVQVIPRGDYVSTPMEPPTDISPRRP